MFDTTIYDDSDGKTPRERENERLLASAEDARKDVRDPHNVGEYFMLIRSINDTRLSDQGRITARERAAFLLRLMPEDIRERLYRSWQ